MAFAVKYRTEFTDILGVDWRVDIEEDGWYDDSNLLTNPGFEGGFTNWNTLNGPNISTVTDEKYDGNMCVRCDGAYNTTNIISQDYQGVKKGQQYTASWWQKNLNITAGTTNPYMRFNIAYFNGLDYVGEAANSVNPPSNSDWQFNSFTFTTRTDLDYDRLRIHSIYMRDATGVIWVDNVKLEEGPVATPGYTELTPTGDPLKIEYLTYSDDLLTDPIKGSTATLNIECTVNFQYVDIYNEADMKYKFKIYQGNTPTLYWQGWVSNDYTEPYDTPPYTVSITALDGLGLLKYIDFKDTDESIYEGREIESTVILNILNKIGHTEFYEFINLYEDRVDNDVDDSILDQIKIEQLVFEGEDCYTALLEILKHYNAIIRQYNGKFIIYRPIEFIGDLVYGRIITADSTTATTLEPDQYLYRAGKNNSSFKDYNGGILMMNAPASSITASQNYDQADSWIKNSKLDINTYNEDTHDFDNWYRAYLQSHNISFYDGWENEKNGMGIEYGGSSGPYYVAYQTQVFGEYITPTTDIIEFSFDYSFLNRSDADITTRIYIRIKDVADNIWLKRKTNSETELDESLSATTITALDLVATPGIGEWKTWKRIKVGLTKPGPYQIYIYAYNNDNLVLGIKNIVFRATSDKITSHYYAVTGKFLWWKYTGSTKQYETEDVTEIIARVYTKENDINGEKLEISYELGDVTDTEIDNVLDQFKGALSTSVSDTFTTAAKRFAGMYAADYLAGGVILTSDGNKLVFTSSIPGTNFTGSTSISNVSGGLSGAVAYVQPNLPAVARVDEITLSGTNGKLLITCNGVFKLLTFNTSIDQTGDDFVNANAADYAAAGVTVTYNFAQNKLIFTSSVAGQDFTGDTTAVTTDGDFAGSVVYKTANRSAQARIDEIILTGDYGSATVTCDAVARLCTYSATPAESYTESWSTRGGSESSNLLELLVDEIALMKSKGRHFIQLNMYEFDNDTFFNMISNLQDPINITGDNYRVLIPNRGSYNVRDREWSLDLIEIGTKAAPAGSMSDGEIAIRAGGTYAWYDYTDAATLTDDGGGLISKWEDKLESGVDLIAAGAARPTLTANGILFNGTANYMKTANVDLNQPTMIYAVMKQVTWTSNDRLWDGYTNDTGQLRQASATPRLYLVAPTSGVYTANLATDTWGIVRVLYNGASSKIQINNNAATTGNAGTNNMDGFTLGCRGDASGQWGNIEVKEVIIRTTTDSETDIYNYLAEKYGFDLI